MSSAGVAYTIAVLLAATFVVAAYFKVNDRAGVVESFDVMGLAAPELLSWLVPVAEVVVAIMLVMVPWVGATLALALLAAFTLVLARLKASGRTIACRCFGAASAETISSAQLIRNGLLIAAAIVGISAERVAPTSPELATGVGLFAAGAAINAACHRRFGAGSAGD